MAASIETRCNALEHGIKLIQGGTRADDAWSKAGKKYSISKATLYRWFQKVKGKPRKDWELLLSTNYKGSTTTAPFSEAAWTFYLKRYKEAGQPSLANAYEATLLEAGKRGWDVPSEATFRRRMNREGIARRTRYDEITLV
ncbi:MAG: hypothetical protein GWN30_02405 [Gammaproteobacteria bacterium]|nr:hypothetical protein [Gammaproteobacteria bacterium]NIW99739.1 hypothetical protein [Phycisphaerae bacterium]